MGIRTRSISTACPSRYVVRAETLSAGTAGSTNNVVTTWPFATAAKLVDLVISQSVVGVGGTSVTFTFKKSNDAAVTSTDPLITLAAGVGAKVDAQGALSTAGCTAPVLNVVKFAKGDHLTVDYVHNGTYSTAAQFRVVAVFEPLDPS